MRVLYLEDVPEQAEIVETFLELVEGMHQVTCEETLADTKSRLKKERFDAILLDMEVPDGSGVELVSEVREVAPDTPIVVLTASEASGLGIACLRAGAQDFLSKRELTPQKLKNSLMYAVTRNKSEGPDLERTLSRVHALHSGSFEGLSDRSVQRYRDLLTSPKLLFTVEHWTLSQAFASEGIQRTGAGSALPLLGRVCGKAPEKTRHHMLSTSELVVLATIAFMADTYRERLVPVKKG